MLIVTGTGRCGTTAITLFCERIGFRNPGGDCIDLNIMGGCESQDVIGTIRTPSFIPSVKKYLEKQNFKVVKTPQFMNSGTPEVWSGWKDKDTKVIICFRDLIETAKSFQKYRMLPDGTQGYMNLLNICEILSTRFETTIYELLRQKIPFRVIEFPNFLFDFDNVFKLLKNFAGFDFDYNYGLEIWNKTMNISNYSVKTL